MAVSEEGEVRGPLAPGSHLGSWDSRDSSLGTAPSPKPHRQVSGTCALACSRGCAQLGEGRRLSKTRDLAAPDPAFVFISTPPPVFAEDGRGPCVGWGAHRSTACLLCLHSPAPGFTVTEAILVPLHRRHRRRYRGLRGTKAFPSCGRELAPNGLDTVHLAPWYQA